MSKGPTATANSVSLVTTANTSILTVIPPNVKQDTIVPFTPYAGPNVTIQGVLNITPGTGTTGLLLKCVNEQGTQVGSPTETQVETAGNADNVAFCFLDSSGVQTGSYSVQVQQQGASANGTVNLVNGYAQTDG